MLKPSRLTVIFSLLLIPIFLVQFSFAAQDKFYLLTLTYDNGNIQFKNVNVFAGIISQANQGGDYRAELISNSDRFLYKTNFDIPTSIHGEEFDYTTGKITQKEVELNNIDIILNVPYFPNGKEINIFDPKNKKILTISVAHFAEVTPTPISPTPPFAVTKLEKGIGVFWIIGGGILLFVIITIGVFVYSRFKKPQDLVR